MIGIRVASMTSTVALCNDTLTALGFQGAGVVVPGSAAAVETSAASVAVTGQCALLPTPMPVSSTNGGRQICVQPYLVPGPGSFWLWDFYIGPVGGGFFTATTVWALQRCCANLCCETSCHLAHWSQ